MSRNQEDKSQPDVGVSLGCSGAFNGVFQNTLEEESSGEV